MAVTDRRGEPGTGRLKEGQHGLGEFVRLFDVRQVGGVQLDQPPVPDGIGQPLAIADRGRGVLVPAMTRTGCVNQRLIEASVKGDMPSTSTPDIRDGQPEGGLI